MSPTAPTVSITRDKILVSASAEFLAHGFSGASLRKIAAGAGVTTGALYKHFADKADLFDALVAPCFHNFIAMFQRASDKFIGELDEQGMDWSSSEQNLLEWTAYIYDHLDTFKLLLSSAEKTSYESFVHMLIDMEVEATLEYLEAARSKGHPVNENISREEVHMLVNAQFSVFFEMVLHDIPREQAMLHIKSIYRFFAASWPELCIG